MIFAIDFDGTIVTPEYPGIGIIRPGAARTIQEMKAHGHTVIIWTCREGRRLEEMKCFLRAAGIPFDRVNDHSLEMLRVFQNNPRKVYADVYIDDRNYGAWTWAEIFDFVRASN